MELSPEAVKIKKDLDAYLEGSEFTYNSDEDAVVRVLNGMAVREQKTGKRYCPCRLATGNPEQDDKIVCPCVYHEQEIQEQGMCHCQLLVARKS